MTCLIGLTASCRRPDDSARDTSEKGSRAADPHSYSRPEEAVVRHLDLDLDVNFGSHTLTGTAAYDIDVAPGVEEIVFDTRDLEISSVVVRTSEGEQDAVFNLGDEEPYLGRALRVELPPDSSTVRITYATSPKAGALQWLTPEQTASGKPFLLSQSQAILARTWVPCQDTPGVRMTYSATLSVPSDLMAVMSAENPTERSEDGLYHFEMPQAIPSYLLAVAAGDLEFRPIDDRAGVYAEPTVVEAAAWEFADVPAMMTAAERLYGPYDWGRYDLLVLPPSFPFGGMENPRLTFATPTIIAGDRSLVALVAHELAHSWSGNLVTNATWDDFWLNEGTTTYITYRLMEELYGVEYAQMLAVLGRQDLETAFEEFDPSSPDAHLKLALAGRDPDDGMTDIAYEKGAAFLTTLETAVGREYFDEFLRGYFGHFSFKSLDTETFVRYLNENLLADQPGLADSLDLEAWIYGPGLPMNAPATESAEFQRVEEQIAAFAGGADAGDLETDDWTTHHWLHFLRSLPEAITAVQLGNLDSVFGFNSSGNSEIQSAWFERAIAAGHEEAYPALRGFLLQVGRRKFLKPLYTALAETPEDLAWAHGVYAEARSGYHSVSSNTLDEILDWQEAG
ncbi:MAG: M1 family metallopeptidase [bacterium]|nr:M1 family metallopeptidase [bacterium]